MRSVPSSAGRGTSPPPRACGVRRSRRRFWKSEDDNDKNDAYRTLHYVLVRLSYVLAPFTPFLAEELFQKLTGGESVHLCDWPESGAVDVSLVERMSAVRGVVTQGLSERARASLKVRQPLQGASISPATWELVQEYADVICEELNVKSLQASDQLTEATAVLLDTEITPELKAEGQMREIVRHIQNARKEVGLEVDDRIVLGLSTDSPDLRHAIEMFSEEIATETLANHIGDATGEELIAKIDGQDLMISVVKDK